VLGFGDVGADAAILGPDQRLGLVVALVGGQLSDAALLLGLVVQVALRFDRTDRPRAAARRARTHREAGAAVRRLQTRLAAVTEFFSSEAVVRELARPAFEVFRKTGTLPDDQHVAHGVVQRVLRGYDALPNTGHSVLDRQRAFRIAVNTPDRPPDPIFDSLFDEAVWAPDPMRWAAREALKELSALGLDVTKPVFAGRKIDAPWRGSVGLTMLGFPDILYTPPHKERAARMFAYFVRVREQVVDEDQAWFDALRDAETPFRQRSELPADELHAPWSPLTRRDDPAGRHPASAAEPRRGGAAEDGDPEGGGGVVGGG